MSFGWSAGDIGPLICLAIKVIDALDSGGGATRHYREATAFLQNLKKTLEPLQASTVLAVYPTYGEQIREQVDKIKLAIDHFLKLAGKFEPDLGGTEPIGCHQHIFPKLKWRFIASKALTELMTDLSGYMRVLDTLLLRIVVETGNKLDDQIRPIEPRLDIVQETLQAHIQVIEQKGEEQQGAILESIQVSFQPLRADLEARDEHLVAFIKQLREDLHPLRDDLEKVERTRDEQHWMLVHGMQQQTAAIKPLHSKISSVQLAADQNFHTVFTKLDDNAAAVDLVNRKVNTIGQFLWGGLRKLPARLISDSAPNSFLEHSLDDSCYLFPQVEDEDGWVTFPERESKPSGNIEPVEKAHEEMTAKAINSLEAPGDNVLAKDKKVKSEVLQVEEKPLVQGVAVPRSIEPIGDAVPETKIQSTLAVQPPEPTKPARKLVVAQNNGAIVELLEAMATKIAALEERSRDRDNLAVKRSDFSKVERAAAAIVQAYEVILPIQSSLKPNYPSGRVYEIPETSQTSGTTIERRPYTGSYADGYGSSDKYHDSASKWKYKRRDTKETKREKLQQNVVCSYAEPLPVSYPSAGHQSSPVYEIPETSQTSEATGEHIPYSDSYQEGYTYPDEGYDSAPSKSRVQCADQTTQWSESKWNSKYQCWYCDRVGPSGETEYYWHPEATTPYDAIAQVWKVGEPRDSTLHKSTNNPAYKGSYRSLDDSSSLGEERGKRRDERRDERPREKPSEVHHTSRSPRRSGEREGKYGRR